MSSSGSNWSYIFSKKDVCKISVNDLLPDAKKLNLSKNEFAFRPRHFPWDFPTEVSSFGQHFSLGRSFRPWRPSGDLSPIFLSRTTFLQADLSVQDDLLATLQAHSDQICVLNSWLNMHGRSTYLKFNLTPQQFCCGSTLVILYFRLRLRDLGI